MDHLIVFAIGFFFSFIGSIPPGTLNLTVLQLGLQEKVAVAFRFALAVAIVEYPYAWIGVQFEYFLSKAPFILANFKLIAAVVMITMGVINLLPAKQQSEFSQKFNASGFRRGMVLSLLNPMAIPYWMVFTAYLKAEGWINLSSASLLHAYVFGTSIGAMALLSVLILFAQRVASYVQGSKLVRIIPGVVLLVLGAYALYQYLLL